ncbi:glycosyltransferase involved in cell wall biosynthesis [Microbacteriaceae bacterium SG_E_30_P1]|uniref:Glycosyltransferase involved in cell wall biosynthesis n=1 Tax=Antiquaquibacter oligotrophicus TaxID=2880260 RepID=A0ABT6KQ09_9MICO|nr:glycosyltransferase [Antiquaquibacter oligotrophicus]MDH6181870.1 glycosyltransferase involved in cell wall biosynthesis [Antiquaquibacter oligotrophicus]UDF12454.1 glycosyltransferase [Antiquaquibacter oligotrophicus]
MKIAHVVTYISSDGAFGGPVTVARAHCAALAELGHEVSLLAASDIDRPKRLVVDGYEEVLFPARRFSSKLGFAGMHSPELRSHLKDRARHFDVAHIHLARDMVTLPAAHQFQRDRVPYFAQPHGMIDGSKHPLAPIVDSLMTKRLLEGAQNVFCLTRNEEAEIRALCESASIARIANGVQIAPLPSYGDREQEVLFLARLHPRKRAQAFVHMAELLAPDYPSLQFSVVGPDEGDGSAVRMLIDRIGSPAIQIEDGLRPEDARSRLHAARVYVLPSVGEIFPMTMLEAFAAGTPTVCTDSLGIAEAARNYGAALVTDGSPEQLAEAVRSVLDSDQVAEQLRQGAHDYLLSELDIKDVALGLERLYQDARQSNG